MENERRERDRIERGIESKERGRETKWNRERGGRDRDRMERSMESEGDGRETE